MNGNRLLILLCGAILAVCLVLSITALTALRNTVDETADVNMQTKALLCDLQTAIDETENAVPVVSIESEKKTGSDFCMKSVGDHVEIYTEGDLLVRRVEINPETLPKKDRELLEAGIHRDTFREMLALIRDFSQ